MDSRSHEARRIGEGGVKLSRVRELLLRGRKNKEREARLAKLREEISLILNKTHATCE